MKFDWAINPVKVNIAVDRLQKRRANNIAANPGKEFPEFTEEDIKNEYIALAGKLVSQETVNELVERSKYNTFVANSGASAKMQEKVDSIKKSKKKED